VMNPKKDKNDNESCQSTINPSEWKGRTIEIDDAGTGDLVGDAFIGFRDTETGKIIFQSVPVGLYNEENKDGDRPNKHIVNVIIKALRKLNHEKGDRILLCRGNCFNLVREFFNENDIYYEPAIVEGELQDAVEGRYIQHLRKLGISSYNLTKESGIQRYFILFNWVCQDFPNRERFVKTGFPSWKKKWRKIAIKRYKKYQRNKPTERDNIKGRANIKYELKLENPISIRESTSKSQKNR
ncbi:MAG: hypothetical protein KAW03_00890, partial [Candidatus Lokiarchaeota archaeon]|nr:hypothetical protein [Candidatus Lokiarchaeota archaeon]